MHTVIIGAGAGGLACAIRLKQNMPDCDVTILERMERAGKKILATGNGRCNFSNTHAEHSKDVVDFFSSLGLISRADSEGRLYPYSNQASTVLDALIDECNRLKVEIVTDCEALKIDKDLSVETDCGIYMADNVVIASGGQAQKNLGSNGSGYELLKSLGHNITPLSPALVMLTSSSKYPRALKGQRVKCSMSISLDGEKIKNETGEVLFTDYGLSGIVTMNLSEIASRNFAKENPQKCVVSLDLIPDMSEEEIVKHLNTFNSLKGILGGKIAQIIEKQSGSNNERAAKISKCWQLIITGTKGYNFAQITSGGADLSEFKNYQSLKLKNLYACGEVLDKQFECGGFNLNFAFYSGICVADEIAKNSI